MGLQGKGPIHLVGCHGGEEITTEADEDAADEEESEDLSEKEDMEASGDVKIKDVGTEDGAKGGSDKVSPAKETSFYESYLKSRQIPLRLGISFNTAEVAD